MRLDSQEVVKPDAVFRLWDSARELIEFSKWIPEVVGTKEELVRIGTVGVVRLETPSARIPKATSRVARKSLPDTQLFIEVDLDT